MPACGVANLSNDSQPSPEAQLARQRLEPAASFRQLRNFGLATLGLALCFAIPLWNLIRFAATSQFHSYILLIPFISAYLVWLKKHDLPPASSPSRGVAAGFLTAGTLV